MSKGSGRRPAAVSDATERDNWARTFGEGRLVDPVRGVLADLDEQLTRASEQNMRDMIHQLGAPAAVLAEPTRVDSRPMTRLRLFFAALRRFLTAPMPAPRPLHADDCRCHECEQLRRAW